MSGCTLTIPPVFVKTLTSVTSPGCFTLADTSKYGGSRHRKTAYDDINDYNDYKDFPFYKLKTGPIFLFFFDFYFQKSHSPCRKKRIFEKKNKKKQQKKTHFYKLKTGPIMLRNILGPVFNLYLDQFLTYKIC